MSLFGKIDKALKSLRNPLFRRALRMGVAPAHEHRAMLAGLGDICTVVDVGANVGQFTLICHETLPLAHIHSFEPLPQAGANFAKVTAGLGRVTLHPVALGADTALMDIHVTARADSSSLLPPALQPKIYPGTHEVRSQQISVMPLDQRLTRDQIKGPALLKIDVQGYEMQVLQGCAAMLDAFAYIFAELSFVELYQGQALAPEMISWLSKQGFELAGVYTSPLSYKAGQMIQGDFLFRLRTTAGQS